jgi:FMN phosphatase YigB (HAD superfamily)
MIKFVLIDIGNTLLTNSDPFYMIADRFNVSRSEVKNILMTKADPWHEELKTHIKSNGTFSSDDDYEVYIRFIKNYQLNYSMPMDGALQLLKALNNESTLGYGFVTNINPAFLDSFRLKFQGLVEDKLIVASCELGVMKPSLEIYNKALESIDLPRNQIVMIGDSYVNDMLPCINLGLKTCWLNDLDDKCKHASTYNAINTGKVPDMMIKNIAYLNLNQLLSC